MPFGFLRTEKMKSDILTVIMPCYNEAEVIASVLPEIIDTVRRNDWQLIVVDDGSTDESYRILQRFAADDVKILHHKLNRGYGAAIKTGIRAADTKYVVTVDADGQHDPADLKRLLDRALEKDADMVVGGRSENMSSLYRSVGKALIKRITHWLVDFDVQDQNSGLKLYDRGIALRFLPVTPDNMAYSDIILLLFVDKRHLVIEEPIKIRPRSGGKSTISARTAFDTLSEIFNLVIMFHPMKLFFPLSLLLATAGVAWAIRCLILRAVISIGGAFILLSAMLVFLMGIITEQFRRLMGRSGE